MPNAVAKKANNPSTTRWLADEDELDFDAEAEADPLEELDVVGIGTAPTPLVIGPLSVVKAGAFEPRAFAAAMYASKVFPLLGGLIAPTIPRPQWPVVLQKNQMGC